MLGGHHQYQACFTLLYNGRATYLVKTGASGYCVARLQLSSVEPSVQLEPVLGDSQCAAGWARIIST